MAWKLSAAALADLDQIAADGALQFGLIQSEHYEHVLVDMFDALAANPYMAPERQAVTQSVRLMPCGAHHILYIIENEDVFVLRVLHGLQNWFDQL